MQVESNRQKRQTTVSIQPQCYPIYGVRIQCREKNFSRQARVCQLTANGEIFLARERIWALDLPGQKKDSLEIRFPPVHAGTVKIYFDDGDNPALNYQLISTITPAWQLFFFAEPEGLPYRISAAPGEEEPQYDNEQIIRQARQKTTPVKALMLSRQGSPLPIGSGETASGGRTRMLLFVALLLCTASLGFGIIKAARKTAGGE